jgi:hypothetical protein
VQHGAGHEVVVDQEADGVRDVLGPADPSPGQARGQVRQ